MTADLGASIGNHTKIKLLTVIHGPTFGGAHNQALQLTPKLRDNGVENFVLLPNEARDAATRFQRAGIGSRAVSLGRPRAGLRVRENLCFAAGFVPNVNAIRRIIREFGIDIVQIHGLLTPQGALAARLEGAAVVWQLIDTRPPPIVRRALTPLVRKLADVVMATGSEVAGMYPGISTMGEKLICFRPPIDSSKFRRSLDSRRRARLKLAIRTDCVVVGSVGNRNPQKGYEFLIRAFSMLDNSRAGLELRIFGEASPGHEEYERRLRQETSQVGLSYESFSPIPDGLSVADVMNAFDVFVLPSIPRSEGIPTVVLEAMACGLPVVATNVGSVREIVLDGVTGFVVPANNASAMASAVGRLVASSSLRAEFAEAALRNASLRGNEHCLEAHLAAYALALRRTAQH